jgi:asparagine synthetase B (glutamine-hydrolysing)
MPRLCILTQYFPPEMGAPQACLSSLGERLVDAGWEVEVPTARQWRVNEIRERILPRLLKCDNRNFMAFSVEGRYPFLDHTLIECWRRRFRLN